MDLFIGSKWSTDKVLLAMAERKSPELFIIPLQDRSPFTVWKAVIKQMSLCSKHADEVFKIMTTDSEVEFSQLASL